MSSVYTDFLYWGFLGLVNLVVSIVVYLSTKLERKQKIASEYELSTRPVGIASGLPFSRAFTYVSFFTGILNTGGAYLRFQRIHFLDLPTIPWLYTALTGATLNGEDELTKLLEAEWLVAMNDWTCLFLASTFLAAGCFNFATVRQLRLRDRWLREMLLPVYRPSWHAHLEDEKFVNGSLLGEKAIGMGGVDVIEEDSEGKSFAVFSQLCAKRG